jgi:type 1 glutamine amidotransferase
VRDLKKWSMTFGVVLAWLCQSLLIVTLASQTAHAANAKRVLIYSGSTGFRHQSIEPGVAALKALATSERFAVDTSEDPAVFTAEKLKSYAVILFVSSTTKPDDPSTEWFVGERRDALQGFVHGGGGIVAVHAATDSHFNWPWYVKMLGGVFERHPKGTPSGVLTVVDSHHPSTRNIPKTITHVDEWYYFKDFDPTVRVLITVDPASIGETDVNPNPVSWAHEFENGRVFCTALGHTSETYSDEFFQKHIAGALHWAARDVK